MRSCRSIPTEGDLSNSTASPAVMSEAGSYNLRAEPSDAYPLARMADAPDLPPADAPLISVERVRVQFGDLAAVRDVSLTLRGGDLLGLIGPNGAGKTTLLR